MKPKILVIEDNEQNLYLISFILEKYGYDVVQALPFVFYTATYTDERDEELGLKVGADKFIRKPIEPDEFINIIKGVIGDVEKGKIKPKKPVLEEEKEIFKLYSERLVKKLEEKMFDLEREVTERKQAEEALRESNRRLEETIGELKSTQQTLIQQERLRALGQMASGVAHDFNNALTPILGYTELLFMMPETLDDKEKTMGYLEQMNTTAKDAKNVVERLRNFYRERYEDEIYVPVSLSQLAKQGIGLTEAKWKDQAQSNGITINVSLDLQKVPFINGNESELRNVLTNLIFNAVDAIHEDGTITIRTHSDSDFVALEVSDTGIGMTEEVQQRCLEPFFSSKGESGAGYERSATGNAHQTDCAE